MNPENIMVRCGACGAKNRIPTGRLRDGPLCGKCRAPLKIPGSTGHPIDVTDQTFAREISTNPGTVLVDCWAPWCGPCRMVAPVLEQLASEYAGQVKIAKLNVDENPVTASQYAIRSIPTLLFFKDGKKVKTLVGALPKPEIEKILQTIL